MNNKKLVLKASAGTGKTYRLSLEYVIALLKGIDFRNIVVMTFTRKATAEIKNAVFEKIKKLVEVNVSMQKSVDIDEKEKADYLNLIENIKTIEPSLKLDSKDFEKLSLIYKEILKNKEKVKIYTIDSFLNIIFKNIVTKWLKIKTYSMIDEEENKALYKKILEIIFTNKKLFNDFESFFSENSEKDMNKYLNVIEKIISDRWKYLLNVDENESFIKKEKFILENSSAKIFISILDYIKEDCTEYLRTKGKEIKDILKKDFSKYIDKDENTVKEFLKDDFKLLFQDGTKGNIYDGGKFKGKDVTKYKDDIEKMQEELRLVLSKEIYNEVIIPYEENIFKLSKDIYRIYDELKVKERKFTFNDIATYSYMAIFDKNNSFIDENGLKDDFYENLDITIDALFIDEFQDTSILQWKILYEFAKKSKSVICVGDEKQSIYGWRDGEKRLFENLENILVSDKDSLKTSYRSDINVVDYCNRIFNTMSKEKDWSFYESEIKSQNMGYVKAICLEDIKNEREDENLTLDDLLIEEISKLESYGNVAVLGRKNDELTKISELLEEKKIDFSLNKKKDVLETSPIFECFEFLRYLDHEDELALFNFISSELSNFGTEEIELLLKNKIDLLKFLNSYENNKFINSLSEKMRIFLDKILYFKKNSYYKTFSVQNLIREIIKKFNFIDYFKKENELKNIFELYLLAGNYTTILDLLRDYREDKLEFSTSKSEKKAVELMTVHKSKGLEFKTVFVLKRKEKTKKDKEETKFLFSMDKNYENIEFSLFFKEKYEKIVATLFKKDYTDYIRKIEEEEINNFYVALTRAKSNLIILYEDRYLNTISDEKIKDFFNIEIGDFVSSKNSEKFISDEEKTKKQTNSIEYFCSTQILDIEEKNFELNPAKFLLETEEKRMTGILVHYFFENIKYAKEEEIEFAKKLCYNKYLSYFGEEKMNKIFSKENIEIFINKDREIFSEKWDNIYSEYVLYDAEEKKEYRIDRLMIKKADEENSIEGEVYIVDFKTGAKNENQLATYKKVLLKNFEFLREYKIRTKFLEFDI